MMRSWYWGKGHGALAATVALTGALALAAAGLARAQGGFTDCNDNGVDDATDIAEGTSADCNRNAIPDECDIESGTSADCNDNGVPDLCDVADRTSEDCNGNEVPDECEALSDCNLNGIPDECDLASGFSEDCNANSLPDECENDCNDTGIPDDCDVSSGTSEDCNGNGVPDECDVAFGLLDCNGNLVPDQCELAGGGGADCNGNGFLDECDIAEATSADCDANGIPDECELIDCNENGVMDLCDIDSATSPDCNENAIPDECEVLRYETASGPLTPIGDGVPQEVMLSDIPAAGRQVSILIEASADLGALVEYLDVFLNGVYLGSVFEEGSDCPDTPDVAEIVVSRNAWNGLVGSDAVIGLFASSTVDPGLPFCETSVSVAVEYQAVTEGDANGNGVPDECDCPEDLDGDGYIGFSDLILFLVEWGPCPGCPEDFNEDGVVDFNDLLIFLASWGECVFVGSDP